MKALIVDDERIIRNGIRAAVPWNTLGISEVFMAASGKDALALALEKRPDIIVTDLHMAGMTGLELIAQIRRVHKEAKIIVLTGYDDFDYARQCLRMHVEDFLLKPIDEKVMVDTIKKSVQSVMDARALAVEQNHMRRIYGTTDQMELESWMRKLVTGEDTAAVVDSICKKYRYEPESRIQIAILIPPVDSFGIRKGESESLTTLTIKNLLIGYLDAGRRGITFVDTQDRIVVGLFAGDKIDELDNCLRALSGLIQDECAIKLRIVAGSAASGFAQAYLSYNDAIYKLEKENSGLEYPKRDGSRLNLFREVYAEFIGGLNDSIGDTEKALRIFEHFCTATDSYNITDRYVTKCCFEIATNVYFTHTVESGDGADGKLDALLAALLSGGRDENLAITRSFIENLLCAEEFESRELVAKIKRHINERLSEDISVAGIAAYFFLSPNYFSRMFKRVANERCSEYIVRKRIDNAEYLLATTNMKIGKIAQETGYRDTNYFSLAFKKQKGVSPMQYRLQKRNRDA